MITRLLFAVFLALFAATSTAEEYYIIKDGKFVGGFEKINITADYYKDQVKIEEGVEKEGYTFAKYTNTPSNDMNMPTYSGIFLYNKDGVNLDKYWEYEVTYFLSREDTIGSDNLKRENFRFEFNGDTIGAMGNDGFYDYSDFENRLAHSSVDVAHRDYLLYETPIKMYQQSINGEICFLVYDSIYHKEILGKGLYLSDIIGDTTIKSFVGDTVRYAEYIITKDPNVYKNGINKLRTVKRPIYRNQAFKDRNGNSNIMRMFGISFGSESMKQGIIYIKDFKLIGKGNRPFFMEDFRNIGDYMMYSNYGTKNLDAYNYNINTNILTTGVSYETCFGADQYYPGTQKKIMGYSLAELRTDECVRFGTHYEKGVTANKKNLKVNTRRLWNRDGNDEYYIDSLYYDVETPVFVEFKSADIMRGFHYYYRIPIKGATKPNENINVKFWLGTAYNPESKYSSDYSPTEFPIKYYFDNGSITEVGEKTESKPLYTGNDDTLPNKIRPYDVNITVPETGDHKFLTLEFVPQIGMPFVFGNLILTAENTVYVRKNYGLDVNGDSVLVSYSTAEDLANTPYIENDNISIYPNPAKDKINIDVEGIENIEIYTATGTLVRNEKGNTINVADLAKGIYIVRVRTRNGIHTGKFTKE